MSDRGRGGSVAWHACAALIERGDRDRFAAGMAAPVAARAKLFPLWALNLEVARAPWAGSEPLIGEMRLQFWRDVLDGIAAGKAPRAHEVAAPLAEVLAPYPELIAPLDGLIMARKWDLYRDPFEDQAALMGHLEATAGSLAWAGARLLGADAGDAPAIRRIGMAHGAAAWFEAVPALEARGCIPLVDGRPEAVAGMARDALAVLRAEKARRFGAAEPALRAGWRAEAILRRALRDPMAVAEGRLAGSEAARRGALMWRRVMGRR